MGDFWKVFAVIVGATLLAYSIGAFVRWDFLWAAHAHESARESALVLWGITVFCGWVLIL